MDKFIEGFNNVLPIFESYFWGQILAGLVGVVLIIGLALLSLGLITGVIILVCWIVEKIGG